MEKILRLFCHIANTCPLRRNLLFDYKNGTDYSPISPCSCTGCYLPSFNSRKVSLANVKIGNQSFFERSPA